MLNFTAIDFETANSYRGSPCALGLVRYRGGVAVDAQRWLIRPPERVDFFSPFNVALHGIDEEAVRFAPRWRDVLPRMVEYIGEDTVVAHNAGFDIGVIRYACAVDGREWPDMRFLCTLVLARRSMKLPSYRLPWVLDACGLGIDDHHDPLADAKAVGQIVTSLASATGAKTLDELAAAHHMTIGQMRRDSYKGSVSISTGGSSRLVSPEVNPDADPDGYLYGRVVVFTGKLMSMTRQQAWEECARVGALAEKTTTRRTNVLVVGDINPAALRPGSNITGKARRAFELQDAGQDIELLTEDDFVRSLEAEDFDKFDFTRLDPSPSAAPSGDQNQPAPSAARTFRALRVAPSSTDQSCSAEGCNNRAAYLTRSRPTYCDAHITAILRRGGLEPLEDFGHPNDYRLTRCITCGCVAHYRFEYTLAQNDYGEPTCRACHWREWAARLRRNQSLAGVESASDADETPEDLVEKYGYQYLGALTAPSLDGDPHRIRCTTCGKISAMRLDDAAFGCTCAVGRGR